MKFLSKEYIGSLYAITSGLMYGLVGYFGMCIINEGITLANMLFWRFLVSTILLAILVTLKREPINYSTSEILKILFYGAIYAISSGMYFVASTYIGTGLSMVIFFTYPVMVMFLNWLLYRTIITKAYYISITLIIIGIICLAEIDQLNVDFLGITFSVVSAVLYALYVVSSKKVKLSPLPSTLFVSIGCTFTYFIIALVNDGSIVIPQTSSLWINILGIALVCTALPILFLLESLKHISTEKASILSVLEPVFVVMVGIALLNEKITILQTIGIIIVLLGALITLFSQVNKGNATINSD